MQDEESFSLISIKPHGQQSADKRFIFKKCSFFE